MNVPLSMLGQDCRIRLDQLTILKPGSWGTNLPPTLLLPPPPWFSDLPTALLDLGDKVMNDYQPLAEYVNIF